ncbi:hypothetical protein BJ165DRAFT_1426481 [Panaeolus papilionaceus]|nr:hypothetical protein BJ165DRAFT_1426481 [Panaeolus papilionaceus]
MVCKNCGAGGEHNAAVSPCLICGHATNTRQVTSDHQSLLYEGHINVNYPNRRSGRAMMSNRDQDCDRCFSSFHKTDVSLVVLLCFWPCTHFNKKYLPSSRSRPLPSFYSPGNVRHGDGSTNTSAKLSNVPLSSGGWRKKARYEANAVRRILRTMSGVIIVVGWDIGET